MNVTGQSLILRFIAIIFYLAACLVINLTLPIGTLPVGILLVGVGVVFSILARRRARRSESRPTEQQKKKAFIIILGASIVGCVGTPIVIYWHDPKADVWTLILISAVLLPLTIGYYYWRLLLKKGV